jgi:hypothetical protein
MQNFNRMASAKSAANSIIDGLSHTDFVSVVSVCYL